MNYNTVDPPLVLIEWEDSCSTSGWCILSEIEERRPLRCFTVGYLVDDGVDHKTVAGSMNQFGSDSANAAGLMTIPVGAIRHTEELTPRRCGNGLG